MDNRGMRAFFVSIRTEQWLKNLFVLAPLLFSGTLGESSAVVSSLRALGAFCLLSSALYLVNDVADAASDREHPLKRTRPIASGALSAGKAIFGALLLAAAALAVAAPLGPEFLAVAAAYATLMLCYSFGLKRIMILDAMVIASGFVLRVYGGAVAAGVRASHWLVVCAFLLALYLAFSKRRQELLTLPVSADRHRRVLAAYSVPYLEQVNNILLGVTVVCYTIYTVAPDTIARVGTDRLLYGSAFVIYGLLRYMALSRNGAGGDNPGRLILRDWPLLFCVSLWAIYNAVAIYYPRIEALRAGPK